MTKLRACNLAHELGAQVEVEKDNMNFNVCVEAPAGKVWIENGASVLIEHQYTGFGTAELWKSLLARMKEGLENDK